MGLRRLWDALAGGTGFQLTTQASNPSDANTLWKRTSDGGVLVGADQVGLLSRMNAGVRPSRFASYFRDDWRGTNIAGDTGSWTNSLINGAGSSVSDTYADANHFGIAFYQTGTAANGACSVRHGNKSVVFGGGETSWEELVLVVTASTGTETYGDRRGYGDLLSAAATDYSNGIYFEAPAENAPNWHLKTAKGGVRTDLDLGVAVVSGAWISLGFVCNAAGTSVQAVINGAPTGAPITTDIPNIAPTNSCALMHNIWRTAGSAQRQVHWDYVETGTVFTTPR